MPTSEGSVTLFLRRLKGGERDALQPIWERYFQRLIGLARSKLRKSPRLAASDEDVALSAIDTFVHAVERGSFPVLHDRNDLWQILVMLTHRKIHRLFRSNALPTVDGEYASEILSEALSEEPTPEDAAIFAEAYKRRLAQLDGANLRKVAIWKLDGLTNEEIAKELGCATRTVERKLRSIRKIWEKEDRP